MQQSDKKLTQVAENVTKVFDAGKKSAYDEFWDDYQQNGNRTNYTSAFGSQWTAKTFKPKYPIRPKNAYFMFFDNSGGKLIIPDFVEHCENNNVVLDFSECTNAAYGIACLQSNHFGVLDFSKCTTLSSLFYLHNSATGVKKIDKLISSINTKFNAKSTTEGTFNNATYLTDITIEGEIGSDINFGTCPLNKASIISVIEHLSAGVSGKTVTFKQTAINNAFSDAEWQELIATIPDGWNISKV